jgi:hypothetical protein
MKATDAASVIDGFADRVVTAKREIFYRRRIFATFAGVFLRMGDTISPAKNALFRQPQYRRMGRSAPQQLLRGSDNQSAYEQSREKT